MLIDKILWYSDTDCSDADRYIQSSIQDRIQLIIRLLA